jgi:hypothetical protein
VDVLPLGCLSPLHQVLDIGNTNIAKLHRSTWMSESRSIVRSGVGFPDAHAHALRCSAAEDDDIGMSPKSEST